MSLVGVWMCADVRTRSLDGTRNTRRGRRSTGGGAFSTWQRSIRTHARAAAPNLLRYL